MIGAFILLTGLLGAVSVSLMATDDSSDAVGYEFVDGKSYPILAHESKTYRHDLERFGGKAAVMADDLNRWFTGLWKGKRLAYTLAVLTTGAALTFFWAARRLSRAPVTSSSDDSSSSSGGDWN